MENKSDAPVPHRAEADAWDEARLFGHLRSLEIPFETHRHPPLHTVEESRELRGVMPGAHIKNMFLKGKKGELWLVACIENRKIHIRDLEKRLGAQKMSFGKPELLWDALGVRPGSVTPAAVLNDPEGRVRIALDAALSTAERVNFHPLHNEATIGMAPSELVRLLECVQHAPLMLDFDELETLARVRAENKGG